MSSRKKWSEAEIEQGLETLDGWSREGDSICKSYEFADFQEAFAFLTRVAILAEKSNHHPEIHNVWNKVDLTLSTHDVGGLTALDFSLARQIDAI